MVSTNAIFTLSVCFSSDPTVKVYASKTATIDSGGGNIYG
jgi:hypothetical protein